MKKGPASEDVGPFFVSADFPSGDQRLITVFGCM
ncbi:Uncharacterised protein [Nocardia brasiliensis]|nr:Uncharacterised protein [Nocardia brasiliensis]